MVKIIIENIAKKEVLIHESNKNALHLLQASYIDWRSECGGKGRCTTCKMAVIRGMENLSGFTPVEKKYSGENLLHAGERLACQVRVLGDIVIRVPDETKLPHIVYTE